jgi:hypothetical protein
MMSSKVQAAKQPEQQGMMQEKQGTTMRCSKATRCNKATNNKLQQGNEQQGATQKEQGMTLRIASLREQLVAKTASCKQQGATTRKSKATNNKSMT